MAPTPNADLVDSIKKLTDAMRGDSAANRDLTLGIGALYKGLSFLSEASNMQVSVLRLNNDVSKTLNTSLVKSAPATTNLAASMQLLESGLEDNSQGLGEFVARAQLLGENIQAITVGLRDLSLNLGLNRTQQTMLAESIQDSAKTYKTSTESVVAGLSRFGESLAILNRTQSGQTNDLITQMTAMTERFAPGALAGILQPLVGAGATSLARQGILGISGEMSRVMAGSGQVTDIQKVLESLVATRDRIVGTGQGAVVGADIFRQLTGISLSSANSAERLLQVIQDNKDSLKQQARVNDALGTINSILEEVKTPITEVLVTAATFLQDIKTSMGEEAVKSAARSAGLFTIISGALSALRFIKFAVGPWGLALAGIAVALDQLGVFQKLNLSTLLGIEKQTEVTADAARAQQDQSINLMEEYNKRHIATLASLARMSTVKEAENMMNARNAEMQMEKQNQLLEVLINSTDVQTETIRSTKGSAPSILGGS